MIHFEHIDSTNQWAKEHAQELSLSHPLWHMTWIVADTQSAGYGRRGNHWLSPKGNLFATLFFCIPLAERTKIGSFPGLLALSCTHVLDKQNISLQIKWPNDLFFEGKKCGGILAESVELDDRLGVVLGIGLNVNAPVQADQPATCLAQIAGHCFSLSELLKQFSTQFETELQTDFTTIPTRIEKRLAFKGELICAKEASGETIAGICEGLDSDGKLLIQLHNGQLKAFSCGEIEKIRNHH
jgi:BirA family biotin operon repressor/biotin-[acetyl-CoA-carboxylase] ligase